MMRLCVVTLLAVAALACPNEKNCQACETKDNKQVCAVCYLGWVDPSGKCVLLPSKDSVEKCERYEAPSKDQPTKCKSCAYGYFESQGKCTQCAVKDCAVCPNGSDCQACLNGAKLQIEPELKCLGDKADVANCDVCQYVKGEAGCKCWKCKTGFALDYKTSPLGVCTEDKVGSCHILDKVDLNRCAYCIPGYYIGSDGKCWNNNREAFGWGLWVLLGLVLLAIPLIWYCCKKRSAHHHHDHYHQAQPIIATTTTTTNQPYTQRLVN